MQQQQNKSEVARLMAQIDTEHAAYERGLTGLAQGKARHDFVNAYLRRVGEIEDQLAEQIGDTQAIALVASVVLQEEPGKPSEPSAEEVTELLFDAVETLYETQSEITVDNAWSLVQYFEVSREETERYISGLLQSKMQVDTSLISYA